MASTEASSSPGLASPSSFFLRPAATTTTAVTPGFQKASASLKSAHFALGEESRRMAPKKAAEKKPRKKLAKSASTILNSDDLASTQFAGIDAADIQSNRVPSKDTLRGEDAPKPKAKKAARKPIKSDNEPAKVRQESAYFAKTETTPKDDSAIELINLDSAKAQRAQPDTGPRSRTPAVQAHRRRVSWTPAKNTTVQQDSTTDVDYCPEVEAPALNLAAVLGSFSYAKPSSIETSLREPSGEALIKRRRMELADETAAPPKPQARKKTAEAAAQPVEKPKKPKGPKKKAQTITELATKAYRPDEMPVNDQATVSSFFAPAQTDTAESMSIPLAPSEEATAKPKNPRKPRLKKSEGDATSSKPSKPAKSTKTGKSVKKMVRIKEADYLPPLYEPERARAEERRQGFLFGTSSQLGVEDSPTFIRQMQFAVLESEALAAVPVSPLRKSCKRVPTAPHGTSLSVGQAGRDLWCSAARDITGEVHNEPRTSRSAPQASPPPPANSNEVPLEAPIYIETSEQIQAPPPEAKQTMSVRKELIQPGLIDQAIPVVVDLCDTSPIVPDAQIAPPPPTAKGRSPSPPKPAPTTTSARIIPDSSNSDDEWMLLKSDESSPNATHAPEKLGPVPVLPSLPSLKRSATSPIRRSALRTLDANISPLPLTSPQKEMSLSQHRAFAASGATTSPQKRPRGRPRKDQSMPMEALSPAPRRVSPEKKKKQSIGGAPVVPPPNEDLSKIGKSASQPVNSSSGFVNIDEISDHESPNTPSPLGRRATSSPPAIRALDLAVTASPSAVKAKIKGKRKETLPVVATADIKIRWDDANWLTAMPELYKQITTTIKSTPPSNDMANPTWHEKILLYDPIVLEDITKWLNEQGVRIEVQQAKAVPKVKGKRKKKDAAAGVDPEPAPIEYETVQLELVPWMVQKWCQEKSVCCLWKEGLRGGVRTRY